MDQSKDALFTAIINLFRFLFFAFLVFGFVVAGKNPLLVRILAIIFLICGPLAFAYGMQLMKKYKSVNDYEPTEILSHKCNGKQARALSQGLGSSGVMFFVGGFILLFLSFSTAA